MFKKTNFYHGGEKSWKSLLTSLSGGGLAITGVIVSGPVGLIIGVAAAGVAVRGTQQAYKVPRKLKAAMYPLSDQTQDFARLRGQLEHEGHVLIARYLQKGKHKEAFIGDKNEPYKGIPAHMILSFQEVLKAADKDSNKDAVVIFFGRPL